MGGGYAFSVLEDGPTRPRDLITEGQLEAVGKLGLSFGKSRRTEAINSIGAHLQVPVGGWTHGQSKLFENGDIRLRGVLALMIDEGAARHLAVNLASAARYVDGNQLLTLVTRSASTPARSRRTATLLTTLFGKVASTTSATTRTSWACRGR